MIRRHAAWIVALAAALMGVLSVLPPGGLVSPAGATHFGTVECPANPGLAHDGRLDPAEYSESYFDPVTKVLVYFSCLDDPNGTVHMALVTPWEGWTEVRVQATDNRTGEFNAIRIRLAPSEPAAIHPQTHGVDLELVDGFLNGTDATFVDDVSAGGTVDVLDPAGGVSGDAYVYELGIPLHSTDPYDCRLTGNGSFDFQLAFVATEAAADDPPVAESDFGVIRIGTNVSPGRWTDVEMSLPSGNAPLESAEILVGLRDEFASPVAFRPLSVFVQTAFGYLDLGTVLTNDQGVGSVEYRPRDEGEYLIGTAFPGGDGLLASVAWHTLTLPSPPLEPSLLPRGLIVIQTLTVLVVGGVWITYAYAFFVVRQVLRPTADDSPRGTRSAGRNP